MLTAQRDSIRLLGAILVASVVLPVALFTYASWLAYKANEAAADRQIDQTRNILTEHGLKVFESVERSMAEINEIVRDKSDRQIADDEPALHARLERLADLSDQVKSFWVFDANGAALATSLNIATRGLIFADRDYFKSHIDRDIGTYVGTVLHPRVPVSAEAFFGVSRRRSSPNGDFAGVIQSSVLPNYFAGFYEKIVDRDGGYAALARSDGAILSRVPATDTDIRMDPNLRLFQMIQSQPDEGKLIVTSRADNIERKISYRKLPGFPVYVLAGLETGAIRSRWLAQIGSYLIFGLPATAALIAIELLALRRTRRLYEEARLRLSAENALKQSQRLESLGRLTGGVAHDFNNLLMVVGGAAQKLRRRHSDPADQRTLDMIESAVAKGASLTRQLLTFSRRHNVSARVVDLGERITKFADVLRQSVRGDVAIDIAPAQPGIAVKIDPNEFEIALLNLTLNARDAMPDGGTIRIATTVATLHQHGPDRLDGDYAIITFADTGHGIPDEIRDRIFEPFFTTKSVDRGTGLGLSQIYGFIRQSNGAISVDSKVGGGTTFTLFLPRSAEAPEPEPDAAPPLAPTMTKRTTLLVVEDHPDVASVAVDYAEQCGFNVVAASSAEDAISVLNHRQDIDLVFSDIVMPGMSGLELARLIRKRYPQTPVVLASGYSDRAESALRDGFRLLQKPYTIEAMQQSLQQAMQDGQLRR